MHPPIGVVRDPYLVLLRAGQTVPHELAIGIKHLNPGIAVGFVEETTSTLREDTSVEKKESDRGGDAQKEPAKV